MRDCAQIRPQPPYVIQSLKRGLIHGIAIIRQPCARKLHLPEVVDYSHVMFEHSCSLPLRLRRNMHNMYVTSV